MSGSNVKDKEPKSTMLCSSEEQQWLQSIKYTFLRTSGCDDARNVKTFIFCKRQLCFSKSPNRATSIVGGQNWSFSSGHVKKKRERERDSNKRSLSLSNVMTVYQVNPSGSVSSSTPKRAASKKYSYPHWLGSINSLRIWVKHYGGYKPWRRPRLLFMKLMISED